jgi:glycine cleavage system regulatory protein
MVTRATTAEPVTRMIPLEGRCYPTPMRTSLVLTVIGSDRPGIVEQLSDQVLAAGANWEESRMARLAGKFAGLLRVSVDTDRADRLAGGLRALSSGDLTIVVERSGDVDAGRSVALTLEIIGSDRPGIVRDISRVLAQHGVNIEELETEVTSAAMSGEMVFRARARVRLPENRTVDEIREILEALADNLMVDLVFDEADSVAGGA